MRLKNLKSLVVAGCFVAGLVACESGPNVPAGEESKFLFALKTSETIGDQVGNVALNENGIMIHPGATAPGTSPAGRVASLTSVREGIAMLSG